MSSEDSKQLSVAELLARNGAQGAASSSSGGGRRRRGGRGISVAELTGDLPVIREGGGHSAHAAPEGETAQPPAYEPQAYEPPAYEPSRFDPSQFGTAAPEPVSYAPPVPEPEPSYSPMSGPITRYDPLSPYAPAEPPQRVTDPLLNRSGRVMPGREMPAATSRHSAPADPLDVATPYGAPAPSYAPNPPPVADPVQPPSGARRSGRRRKHEPDESATQVYRLPGVAPVDPARPDLGARNGNSAGTELPEPRSRQGRAARRRAAEVDEGPSTAPWSPPADDFPQEPTQRPLSPLPEAASLAPPRKRPPAPEPPDRGGRRPSRRDAQGRQGGALPAWSVRRHAPTAPPQPDNAPESGGISTAAWSLASQDQQLVSGSTVAGDLLRDGVERAERDRAGRKGREPVDLLDADEGYTDVYEPFSGDADAYDEDGFDGDDYDDYYDGDAPKSRRASKTGGRRSRATRSAEHDANRRQWMVLGGQSAGAAIAGMLLFKGFERMWEMLPWVALTLAMIVILGLVTLVRILRRTDDILSTVIAVIVGIFVTLGPLAFLLSTN
ncbi:hypothetical protein [Nocardia sp. NPDC005366]|uniref:hypothetical protein n=1 Tax=Nocardia sp. NPDC005366 TaxID=3156878 RepID=UPI0033A60C66